MATYIYAKQFFYEHDVKEKGYLEIRDNGTFGQYTTEKPNGTIIDYSNYSIAPGLVDTHIHGYLGHDVMDNDIEGIKMISNGLPSCGVTSYLPTTLTASADLLNDVCQTIGQHASHIKGAKIQGIFLEGPFFCEKYKGAQNPKYMSDPQKELLDKWQDSAQGWVKKIAIAPEREGSVDFIKHAKSKDIYVALAHTDATYQECLEATNAGANIFVHVYNGMRGLHHREPGVVGAALTIPTAFDELICDGHHVNPISAKIVMDCHGRDKTMLITDCMRAGGLGECQSTLGEFDVIVKDGTARLVDSGSLAGSILELITGVQNVVRWGIATPHEALKMASLVPAQSVGIDNVCGRLDEGYPADFIVLNDSLELQATYIDGKAYYTK
ncbi:N-acetylglucosamine-6-phosphate deacetylase [Carnobacteriaceae bacterium zg-84]|uniref:N-acetylglucosamine-6-phosphate deacetylase n=1 Tax=Granulicatella sp. zg-84 TaxID=2678503 RepID=UPI0013C072FA|nr:N-acetylglucosamine-6-phosphate deacetylase [Granulicatella sp. zg-84]NEW66889.1 N-acetylglucosamine-6-phosphate deacetylase [Granulicatella sp. zg-84]QMI85900.1 N-acetylglucosamine-6-phosphate deacetylase [Carnobacteriaceae bacterium zg-84]